MKIVKNKPCVYVLKNVWDEYYVGSTINLPNRLSQHKCTSYKYDTKAIDTHDMELEEVFYFDEDIDINDLHELELVEIINQIAANHFVINSRNPLTNCELKLEELEFMEDE